MKHNFWWIGRKVIDRIKWFNSNGNCQLIRSPMFCIAVCLNTDVIKIGIIIIVGPFCIERNGDGVLNIPKSQTIISIANSGGICLQYESTAIRGRGVNKIHNEANIERLSKINLFLQPNGSCAPCLMVLIL